MSTAERPERPEWQGLPNETLLGRLVAAGEAHEEARILVEQWRKGNDMAADEITRVLDEAASGG